ncbi:ABC transporter substrate-binding protein [Psychromonas marina]|uniref:ABC transporter substrate-binding protein n=1 Tax=Psychromonas marina TaxID=88364 RepID=A0ABQ6E0F9_9GAMM|nr:transporter substrate-binding domain-containing protein [Psychromonas marina]GLS90914.1 ABC transporter substrate-binding protein [Psychromonas marina]
MPVFIIVFLLLLSSPIKAVQITTANAHWPPWRVIEADGTLSGIELDILKRLTTHLDFDLIIKGCGWKRCLKHMEVGESDVMTGLFKTAEREQYMKFITPAYRVEKNICFYQNKDSSKEIYHFKDLYDISVGVVKKVAYFEPFDSDPRINKLYATTDEYLFRLLQADRLDAVVIACVTGDVLVSELNLQGVFKHANYVYRVAHPVYLAISKKSPFLAREAEISKALQGMIDRGEVQKIMASYGVQDLN